MATLARTAWVASCLTLAHATALAESAVLQGEDPSTPNTKAAPSPLPIEALSTADAASAGAASADAQLVEARQLFWQAHEQYKSGNYARAVELFQGSYERFPQREVLYNIALASAKGGRCAAAQSAYAEFSKGALPKDREQAGSSYAPIQHECQAHDARAKRPSAAVDQEHAEPQVAAALRLQTAASAVNVGRSPNEPAPPPTPHASPVPDASNVRSIAGWTLIAGATAAAAAAVYLDATANAAKEDIERLGEKRAPDAGDRMIPLREKYERTRLAEGLALGAAVGFAAAGAALLLVRDDDEQATVRSMQLGLNPGEAMQLGLSGSF